MVTHKTGGEVDAFCTKCQLTLAHTILAMVGTKIARVRCNTCNKDHAMRAAPGASKARTAKPKARSTKAERVVISFEERLGGRDPSGARAYSPRERYVADDVINHPTFGLGIVTVVRPDKIDIDFKTSQKTLVHGRDGAASAPPTFQRPTGRPTGPADKPQVDPVSHPPVETAPTAMSEE
jgi:hypothetical protein